MKVLGINLGNDLGSRGLVVYDGQNESYRYITEKDWRAKTHVTSPIPAEVASLRETKSVMAKVRSAIYVDLDMMAGLEKPSGETNGNVQLDTSKASVVFREGGAYFQIMIGDLPKLPPGFEGSARVLVNRGAVLAAIPKNDIPSGSYCVLVNLPSLQDPR